MKTTTALTVMRSPHRLSDSDQWKIIQCTDFTNGWVEFAIDSSFDSTYEVHVRARIRSLTWRWGRPRMIEFDRAMVYINQNERRPIVWRHPSTDEHWIRGGQYDCRRRVEPKETRRFVEQAAFKDVLACEGGFGFRDHRGNGIALYTQKAGVPLNPMHYQSPDQRVAMENWMDEKFPNRASQTK